MNEWTNECSADGNINTSMQGIIRKPSLFSLPVKFLWLARKMNLRKQFVRCHTIVKVESLSLCSRSTDFSKD